MREALSIVTAVERRVASALPEGRLLVCISGGADSMTLLHVCRRIGRDCVAVHCDFHLRGDESERDRRFVEQECRRLGMELHVEHFDVPAYMHGHGVSIEMACRELRYALFRRLRTERDCSRIVVAHNADDDTETMLLNLFRGTGLKGLCGMQRDTGEICRPLLSTSRAEIEAYLEAIGEKYIVDSSNATTDFLRNYIRLTLLPAIEQRWPGVRRAMSRTRENLQEARSMIESMTSQAALTDNLLLATALETSSAPTMLVHAFLEGRGASTTQIREMAASQRHGARWVLPDGEVVRDGEGLHYIPNSDKPLPTVFHEVVELTPEVRRAMKSDRKAEEFYGTITIAELHWRAPRQGDRIRPFGMKGSRLVSDVLHEARLTPAQRKSVQLMVDDADRIVWIPGVRRSALYSVGDIDSEALHIWLEKN